MDNNIQRELLQEFINNPKQKDLTKEQYNNSIPSSVAACEDNFNIYVKAENSLIKEARFEGAGCAISFGSTEALLRVIEGKTINQVKEILNKYELLIEGKIDKINIEELDVFQIVQTHLSRRKCARAPIGAIKKAIE